ncbi:MAG: undecaprenyl diphosphate synthase family protein [Dehalococcoidia bacterium]|nr:undecaprenyl diphosphate synthase family protein [Dehalococcoidia bacterium]
MSAGEFGLGTYKVNGAMTENVYPAQHAAIILNDNGGWTKQRSLYRVLVRQAGSNTTKHVIRLLAGYGMKRFTLYVSFTENWKRARSKAI